MNDKQRKKKTKSKTQTTKKFKAPNMNPDQNPKPPNPTPDSNQNQTYTKTKTKNKPNILSIQRGIKALLLIIFFFFQKNSTCNDVKTVFKHYSHTRKITNIDPKDTKSPKEKATHELWQACKRSENWIGHFWQF